VIRRATTTGRVGEGEGSAGDLNRRQQEGRGVRSGRQIEAGGAVDHHIGSLVWLLAGHVGVLARYPYLGPCGTPRFAVSFHTSSEPDIGGGRNPTGEVPRGTRLGASRRDPLDDHDAAHPARRATPPVNRCPNPSADNGLGGYRATGRALA
jgi:hypothetical protein